MEYTSAQAAKLLRKFREEHRMLLTEEAYARFFQAATGEDLESLRPEYDYEKTQEAFAEMEKSLTYVYTGLQELTGFDRI